jgi:hypothetical protein
VVHHLGVRLGTLGDTLHRAGRMLAEPACFDLTEVHVVDRGEPTK